MSQTAIQTATAIPLPEVAIQPANARTDFVTDAVTGNWRNISRLLVAGGNIQRMRAVHDCRGSVTAVTRFVQDHYQVPADKAHVMLANMVHTANRFDTSVSTYRQMRQYWSEIELGDLNAVAGQRSRLADLLQDRYGLTRADAWEQVHTFFVRAKIG